MSKIIIIVAIVAIIVAAIYFETRRSGDMQTIASRLGLSFHPGQHQLPAELDDMGFDLFTQGPPNIKNRMQGERNGRSVSLFDFTYTSSVSGEGQRETPLTDDQVGLESRQQSVVWLRANTTLPDFDLSSARSHRRTVASRFGLNRVTLDGQQAFNRDYILLARDDQATRPLFTPRVLDFLQAHPGMVFESRGRNVLIYRFEALPKPKQLAAFLAEAEALLELFEGARP